MALFGRKRADSAGYEDKAALKGFGGYQQAGSPSLPPAPGVVTPTPSYLTAPVQGSERRVEPHAKPWVERPKRRWKKQLGCGLAVLILVLLGTSGLIFRAFDKPAPKLPPFVLPPTVVVPAVVAGWQPVAGRQGAYAYDVPPAWTPEPDTVHGWEKDATGPETDLSTSASYFNGFCPQKETSRRAGSGVTAAAVGDPAVAAAQVATTVALHRYTSGDGARPTLTVGEPQPAEVDLGGGKKGVASITMIDVTSVSTEPCASQHALVGALALTPAAHQEGVVMVVYADQSLAQPATEAQLLQILHSYRAVPAAERTTLPPTH
jgi:hypothetical protein